MYCFVRKRRADRVKLTDTFLDGIVATRTKLDKQVELSTQEYEREFKERFSEDIELKRRLSGYAKDNGLDKALIEVWERVRNYAAAIEEHGADVVTEINGLDMVGGHINEDGYDVAEFAYNGQTYSISTHKSDGYEGDTFYDISLSENGTEMFAIKCILSIDSSGYDVKYGCVGISALRRRGNWPQMLMEYQARKQLDQNKFGTEIQYSGAKEIASRFEG
jgi:hypothetical protein